MKKIFNKIMIDIKNIVNICVKIFKKFNIDRLYFQN